MSNIREFYRKIKVWGHSIIGEWGLGMAVILAVLAAFGLGRLSALMGPKPLVEVQNAAAAASAAAPVRVGGGYIAALGGEVYYFPWCSGALSIPPEKQRFFSTEAAAKKAGYRAAKNCRGLAE